MINETVFFDLCVRARDKAIAKVFFPTTLKWVLSPQGSFLATSLRGQYYAAVVDTPEGHVEQLLGIAVNQQAQTRWLAELRHVSGYVVVIRDDGVMFETEAPEQPHPLKFRGMDADSAAAPRLNNVTLDGKHFIFSQRITNAVLDDFVGASASVVADHLEDTFILQIKAFLYTRPLEDVTITYPTTWQDAFKDRWMKEWEDKVKTTPWLRRGKLSTRLRGWLVGKLHIRYTTKKFTAEALYPRLKPLVGITPQLHLTIGVEKD